MITENETVQTHSQALQENGMYVFMGEVNDENICPIVEWILHENFVVKKKRKDQLKLKDRADQRSTEVFTEMDRNAPKVQLFPDTTAQ